jgi:hypothetical protein
MGWATGSQVIEEAITGLTVAMVNDGMLMTDAETALYVFIQACEGADWDTQDEVLDYYRNVPWVVSAFSRAMIYIPCHASEQLEASYAPAGIITVTCELPLGHKVDHYDEEEDLEWPIANR